MRERKRVERLDEDDWMDIFVTVLVMVMAGLLFWMAMTILAGGG